MAILGQQRANHKYVARVKKGDKYQYFYTLEELNNYKGQKSDASTSKAGVIRAPKGRLATNAAGKVVSGSRPGGGKPAGITDHDWEVMQKLWSARYVGEAPVMPGESKIIARRKAQIKAKASGIPVSSAGRGSSSGGSSSSSKSSSSITAKQALNFLSYAIKRYGSMARSNKAKTANKK